MKVGFELAWITLARQHDNTFSQNQKRPLCAQWVKCRGFPPGHPNVCALLYILKSKYVTEYNQSEHMIFKGIRMEQ